MKKDEFLELLKNVAATTLLTKQEKAEIFELVTNSDKSLKDTHRLISSLLVSKSRKFISDQK